ncbi:MAG: cellulase family glycosylhydrolase [Oscillospiraceae bacterium]|jgi:endoglycosylceramidase|nr:cellulase family glycosylhydrolase [Oscillospiraceae bacterium]
MQSIKTEGLRFLDAQGRERIFHGVNLKGYENYGLLDEDFFRRAAALGFNCLRLAACWENLEPEKGKYNEEMLRKIDVIFDLAAQYGVYVFLDLHQDLYSSFGVGNGDGAPAWATLADGRKRAEKARLVWAEGYFFSKAVHAAFDHFWNNDPTLGKGLQDHMAELWQFLAQRYAHHPAFFGFDLLNEPFPGSDGGKVFRKLVGKLVRVCAVSPAVHRVQFLKGGANKATRPHAALDVLTTDVLYKVTTAAGKLVQRFDTEKYTPFVQRMTDALRAVTPNGVIFMEHSYYSNLGVPFAGKAPTQGGAKEEVVYSPHAYDFTVDTPAYQYASNERVGFMFDEARRAQERLNTPVLVGEWGGGGEGESFFPHIAFLLDRFDSFKWSNVYFTYGKNFFNQPIMRLLSRPYPVAVNGEIVRFQSAPEAGSFTLDFTQSAATDPALPTELYLPRALKSVEAEGFTWREEAIPGGTGLRLLLTGGGAGEHRVTVQLA